jgi:beta-lactam-binding protein with PASTA domain
MNWFRAEKWYDLIKHLVYITVLGVSFTFIIFYVVMPISTNHGETITVPDVIGISYDELDLHLTRRNLHYVITEDSGYSPNYDPLTVLQQHPKPFSKVKEQRKIYLTLNSATPPMVRMPNLVEGSLKNAQMVLSTYDLKLGKRSYIPDPFFNTVLKQSVNGQEIAPGEMIPKGTAIDLEIGDGRGNVNLESPSLIGLDEESAIFAIIGSGLEIGQIMYQQDNLALLPSTNPEDPPIEQYVSPGDVVKQHPPIGRSMRISQKVDIWIYKPDSTNLNPSILDQ